MCCKFVSFIARTVLLFPAKHRRRITELFMCLHFHIAGGYLESGDSSRSTTATHSRTSSEGVTPSYAVVNQGTADSQMCILYLQVLDNLWHRCIVLSQHRRRYSDKQAFDLNGESISRSRCLVHKIIHQWVLFYIDLKILIFIYTCKNVRYQSWSIPFQLL